METLTLIATWLGAVFGWIACGMFTVGFAEKYLSDPGPMLILFWPLGVTIVALHLAHDIGKALGATAYRLLTRWMRTR